MEQQAVSKYLVNGVVLWKKYTIVQRLDSGGFGNTYLATDSMGMQVVVKEFYISGVCSRGCDSRSVIVSVDENKGLYSKQKEKFIREARRIHALNHPNIVKVLDAFEENDTAYYVMNYIDGQSLAHMSRPIHEEVAKDYLRQILSALEYVHNRGLLHLDIKPSNIMIDRQGNAILIDFGASKQLDTTSMTTSGIAYTPGYAPIEQMNNNEKGLGTHSDMYSLGATLYNILTGRKPPMPSEIMDEGFPTFPLGLSSEVASLIVNMMKVPSKERIKNVAEIKRKYGSFLGYDSSLDSDSEQDLGSETVPGDDSGQVTIPGQKTVREKQDSESKPNRNSRKWASIIIVVIVILLGVVVAQVIDKFVDEPIETTAGTPSSPTTYKDNSFNSQNNEVKDTPRETVSEQLATEPAAQEEAPISESVVEEKKSRDGYYSYNGYFSKGDDQWAVKIKFTLNGNKVSNCSYENVAMGLKPVTWDASFDGSQLIIYGKNHGKPMTIYLQFDDESGNIMSGTVGDMSVKLYR